MSKWKADAALAVTCPLFIHIIIEMCHKPREPFEHFYRWRWKPVEIESYDGELRQPGHLAQLVWYKADEILAEFEKLTHATHWGYLFRDYPLSLVRTLTDSIMALTYQHHADFHRRVVTFCVTLPISLLLFGHRAMHIACPRRKELATLILDTAEGMLEINALKLKWMYREDVQYSADTGKCLGRLFVQANLWAENLPVHTGDIEGRNNEIVAAVKFAPHMKLPLLSSRITSRYATLSG